MNSSAASIPVLFLAGGFGTRLRQVNDQVPKPMVPVLGKPFLHWLAESYYAQGFREFVFSTGYKAEVIESYDWERFFPKARVQFYREETPLGTGGATKTIFEKFHLERAWIVNGDTLLPAVLPAVEKLRSLECDSVYMVLKPTALFDAVPNLLTADHHVIGEQEGGQYFDAGAVYVEKKAFRLFSGQAPFSMHALLKPAMNQRRVGYWVLDGTCYDMGTPERLKRLEGYLQALPSGA